MRPLLLAVLLVALSPAPAAAQADTGAGAEARTGDDEARRIFNAGQSAYDDGRFPDALAYFERAYEVDPRPELHYSIGSAAERANEVERAIEAFEAYLAERPEALNRGEVEARLSALRERLAASAPPDPQPHPQREPTPPGTDDGAGVLPWVLIGTGGALVAGGTVLLVMGASAIDRVSEAPRDARWADYRDDHENGPTLANLGLVLGGVGLAAAAVGVVLLVTGGGSDTEPELSIGPNGLTVRGRF